MTGIFVPIHELTDVQMETALVVPKQVNKAKMESQTSWELPEELQTIVDEAKVAITPKQAQDFQHLLIDYMGIITTKVEPLGQTLSSTIYRLQGNSSCPIFTEFQWD